MLAKKLFMGNYQSLSLICLATLVLQGCAGGGYSGDRTFVTGVCGCKPYYVRGSWHYPQNYYEYEEEGLASWYGPGFHGKPKPFGEKFDQYALTAAHKTLPLPTIAKVTNTETGQSVIVLIDDRGPFVYEGRIIDLSVGAAKAIGIYQKGIGRVKVQSLVEESKALSDYLKKHGHRPNQDPYGRTWFQIYEQEIKGRYDETPYDSSMISHTEIKTLQAEPLIEHKPKHLDEFLKDLNQAEESQPYRTSPVQKTSKNIQREIHPIYKHSYVIELDQQFLQKNNAESLSQNLKKHFSNQVIGIQHKSGQTLWGIKVGPFSNKNEAEKALTYLKNLNHTGNLKTVR